MYTDIEAQVALAKCNESRKIYGVRMEKSSLGWMYNWAFALSDKRAKAENYEGTVIEGKIFPSSDYPGCPYCGTRFFVICTSCRRLNCNNTSSGKAFVCNWCGAKGELEEYRGTGISSSIDV